MAHVVQSFERVSETRTRVVQSFERVSETPVRVPGTFARVSEAFARVSEPGGNALSSAGDAFAGWKDVR